jgi:tRNA U55 pseudouridine synthase TruB
MSMMLATAMCGSLTSTVHAWWPAPVLPQILSNAVLLVDKPARWSGADVVRQLKSALKADRVCFGAPLEMEATGLLIILLGKWTSVLV